VEAVAAAAPGRAHSAAGALSLRASAALIERAAVLEVLDSGWLTTGSRSVAFEEAFREAVGARHAVAVNSATAALHLAMEAMGIGPGDEVVVPTYTFTASAETVIYLGARPVLADVDVHSASVTAETVAAVLTERTRAVEVVHVAGLPADVGAIGAAAPGVEREGDYARHRRRPGAPAARPDRPGAPDATKDKLP
jgi:dTDP-4-amino-4,6-dideoxygalactose transaminase